MNELAQASVVFPNVLKRVDEDKLAEAILDATNFPQNLMRSDEEVEAINEAERQAMAQQQAKQALGGMAEAYPKIKDAPEEGSPAGMIGEAIGV